MLKKIFNFLLDLIFPIECLGCNKEDVYLCDDCLKKIQLYERLTPFEHPLKYLNGVLATADYRQTLLQKAIHNYKFRFIQELAKPLANLLIEFYKKQSPNFATPPLVMPVPLNKKRLLERGFNQAELLAQEFAGFFSYPLLNDIVIRSRNTAHQVGLNKKERLRNMQNAFKVTKPEIVKNQIIILIDDVVTTGSTLEEIAKVLKENGAKEVWGITVAKD